MLSNISIHSYCLTCLSRGSNFIRDVEIYTDREIKYIMKIIYDTIIKYSNNSNNTIANHNSKFEFRIIQKNNQ